MAAAAFAMLASLYRGENVGLWEILASVRLTTAGQGRGSPPVSKERIQENYGKLPLAFEANVGQADASVQFLARGSGYGLFLTGTEAVMVLKQAKVNPIEGRMGAMGAMLWRPRQSGTIAPSTENRESMPPVADAPATVVRMQLLGGNPAPQVVGRDELPGKVSYFIGNDPTWSPGDRGPLRLGRHRNHPPGARSLLRGAYPGTATGGP